MWRVGRILNKIHLICNFIYFFPPSYTYKTLSLHALNKTNIANQENFLGLLSWHISPLLTPKNSFDHSSFYFQIYMNTYATIQCFPTKKKNTQLYSEGIFRTPHEITPWSVIITFISVPQYPIPAFIFSLERIFLFKDPVQTGSCKLNWRCEITVSRNFQINGATMK